MSWEFTPRFDAAHRAALEAAKPLVYVCPPTGWAARPLFAALPVVEPGRLTTVVLTTDTPLAQELARSLHDLPALTPLHVVSGLTRAERLLRQQRIGTLVAGLPSLLELIRRAALKLEGVRRVVVAWPEAGGGDILAALDTVLAESPAATRLVITADDRDIAEFLERHARRAPILWAARPPSAPAGALRYAISDPLRRPAVARAVLDALDPARTALWDPRGMASEQWGDLLSADGVGVAGAASERAALALALDLPTAEALAWLRQIAQAVVVLVSAAQLAYLQRLAAPLEPLALPLDADRARDWHASLYRRIAACLDQRAPLPELLALEGLFARHDPAIVAAALLSITGGARSSLEPELVTWARLHLNVGRRDDVRPGDLVGVLVNAVGLAKNDIGPINIKDGFSLVDIRATEVERAARGLTGATVRGRRVIARLDTR